MSGMAGCANVANVCPNAEKIGGLIHDVENLNGWQKTQNGSLIRLADKIEKIESRLNQIQWWLIGLMGGIIASLIMLVINITIKGR